MAHPVVAGTLPIGSFYRRVMFEPVRQIGSLRNAQSEMIQPGGALDEAPFGDML